MLASGPGGARSAEEWLDRYYGTADQRDDAVLRQRDGSPLTAWQAFVADTATRQARCRLRTAQTSSLTARCCTKLIGPGTAHARGLRKTLA